MTHSARIELRLPPVAKKRWTALAARTGESLASWLRRLAYEAEARAAAEQERR